MQCAVIVLMMVAWPCVRCPLLAIQYRAKIRFLFCFRDSVAGKTNQIKVYVERSHSMIRFEKEKEIRI